jgi:serine protease AprX
MSKQYKLRFNSSNALHGALSAESTEITPQVISEKRLFVSFSASAQAIGQEALGESAGGVPDTSMQAMEILSREYDAEIVEDYQYELDDDEPDFSGVGLEDAAEGTLDDVLDTIHARDAWSVSRGQGVSIAIVDTGVSGTHAEFPVWKRVGAWAPPGEDSWIDERGHGTMCACISTATRAGGGRYDGIAPDAGLIACKTRFYDSELAAIYDMLTDRALTGERIVASNSFGRKTGSPPPVPADSDFIPALDDAVQAGIAVFFSAGNNHARAGGSADTCSPNSVWLHKSRADIAAVATCDLEHNMWFYSSRGPGQHHGHTGTNRKPDFTAPTPRNGKVLYGDGERVLKSGWGTSGACPQAAGLAALLISNEPAITSGLIYETIRDTAVDLGFGWHCQGAGMLNCRDALAKRTAGT